ncbi:MAG: choice-of-anchor M domain-containing protein [Actinomyces urogenitalis]|nr:choice-of-anchor M domain-containing protein [Actinomyces urogenitalis]
MVMQAILIIARRFVMRATHRGIHPLLALFTALFTLALFATPTIATPAPQSGESTTKVLLTRGHADVFALVPNGPTISLVTKEDVTTPGAPTYHNPAKLILGVTDAAKTSATEKIEGVGTAGYALPQSENPALLWPGWDSNALAPLRPTAIRLVIDEVSGPGRILLWRSAAFGATSPIFEQGSLEAAPGRSILQSAPAHEHANWLFTAAGTYSLTLHGEVDTPKGRLVSDPAAYTFAVGATAIAQATPGASAPVEPSTPSTGSTPPPAPAPQSTAPQAPVQPAAEQCLPTPVTSNGSGTAVGGSHTIRANTHVHPNWVFTAPGVYKVSITQTTTLKSGARVSTSDILSFNVGGAGNADSGHFDIGTSASPSSISMLVKDDRSQPARWVAPSSLVFGLGSAAETTAPAGIEFIAKQGQRIWMISSSQVPSVPWLGANTMHPSLFAHTTGDVTWTLNGVSGPGSLAVFESGNFGSLVGTRWFGGIGSGSTTVYVGRTADGRPCELDQATIDRLRAEGKIVDGSALPGGLATTGARAAIPVALASLLALAGLAARRWARR